MRILHFDSIGGASGDMILGALFDLGVAHRKVAEMLGALIPGEFRLEVEEARTAGLRGKRVDVKVRGEGTEAAARHLGEIEDMLGSGALPREAAACALEVFRRLAAAEAKVHGSELQHVHFHEVGAVDALVDVAGACLALSELNVAAVSVGVLPLGSGTVECAHGTLPVPVPTTLELLRGHPVIRTDEEGEMVTPTGAALLMSWKSSEEAAPSVRVVATGYGVGHRRMRSRPNLLRAILFEGAEAAAEHERCLVLETNVDDATPEQLGVLVQMLMEAGALDVYTVPAQMKKQRPGVLLTVICDFARRDALLDLIFRESTTFGVRIHEVEREMLARRRINVETPYGRVGVKVGSRRGRETTFSPEMDECVRVSRQSGVPVREVYRAALAAARTLPDAGGGGD